MTVSHRYRNFGRQKPEHETQEDPALEKLEELKLEAFENGYQAGWDDSLKAQAEDRLKISTEFGQNLQQMSFTYHEALSKLTVSMEPVIREMLGKLLPEVMMNALGAHILAQIRELVVDQVSNPIEIVVASGNVEAIKALAGDHLGEPFTVVAEPSLGEGQAFVRIGNRERQVDLESVVRGVSDAMQAFFYESGKGSVNE